MEAMRSLCVILLLLCSLTMPGATGTRLTVQVNSADTGRAIDRASVIVRFRHGLNPVKMKKIITSWEMKTSQEGSVSIPEMPKRPPMSELPSRVISMAFPSRNKER